MCDGEDVECDLSDVSQYTLIQSYDTNRRVDEDTAGQRRVLLALTTRDWALGQGPTSAVS